MSEKSRILIVDDEPDIVEFLSFNFEREGYIVKNASNGIEAIDLAMEFKPRLIIMDLMMPDMDGIEACQIIRQNADSYDPVILLLTARGEDYSQIAGFDAGADDYVVKPVSPKVLIARVKVLLKRKKMEDAPFRLNGNSENHLTINREYYSVFKNNKEIQLPRKEFEILSFMAEKPNRLFSREEIFNHIWGTDTIVGERTMDVYIRKIRSKIGDDYIKTIKGVGYKFVQV
jgi:two-component system alkaline phosphatase synthesis response regulator PhoP